MQIRCVLLQNLNTGIPYRHTYSHDLSCAQAVSSKTVPNPGILAACATETIEIETLLSIHQMPGPSVAVI